MGQSRNFEMSTARNVNNLWILSFIVISESFRCIHLQQETTINVWCSTCILVHSSFFPWSFLFRHIPNNLSNYNVLTTNAPFFYQISGTWSNHEGSILSWCRIPRFYGFLLCYRGRTQGHNVSKRGGHIEVLYYFVSNFVKSSILSLPRYEQKSGAAPQLYTPFVLWTLVDSELRSRRNRTFDGPFFMRRFTLKWKWA